MSKPSGSFLTSSESYILGISRLYYVEIGLMTVGRQYVVKYFTHQPPALATRVGMWRFLSSTTACVISDSCAL